jgi:hypothetical protein
MFKRILTVALCFVLVLGVSTLAFAKKAKVKAQEVSAEETQPETVVHKMSEPKGDLKDKLGLAFTTAGDASLRMWLTKSMGLDLAANINVGGGSDFGLLIGANIVFPILEEGPIAVYVTPGLSLNFDTTTVGVASTGNLGFNFIVGLQAEAFIVKNVVSVGGTLGMNIGINVASAGGTSNTSFLLGLGTSSSSLFVRVYM